MTEEGLLRSALHARHVERGARMGAEAGWDVPLDYGDPAAEVCAVRARAGAFDLSHEGRIRLRGAGAVDLLERLCTHDVARQEDDSAARTLLCNERGGILADGLLVRAEDFWLLTCGAAERRKVLAHVAAHAAGLDVKFDDQTERTAQVMVAGPRATAILDAVLPVKPSTMAPGAVLVGSMLIARYIALRAGCTDEWSLTVILPNLAAGQAWRFITEKAGANCIAPAGLTAMETLRIEAGVPRYGHELSEEIDPVTAGLGASVDFGHDFIGRDAVRRVKEQGPARIPAGLVAKIPEGQPREVVVPQKDTALFRSGGEQAGMVTSASHSPTLEAVIALAYVVPDAAETGTKLHWRGPEGTTVAEVVPLPFRPRAD